MFWSFVAKTGKAAGGKGKGGKGIVLSDYKIPVEKDTQRLVDYVCGSNINEEGEDIKVNISYGMNNIS